MTRHELLRHLPGWAAGDLEEPTASEVHDALAADPSLRTLAEALRQSQQRAFEVIVSAPTPMPKLPVVDTAVAVPGGQAVSSNRPGRGALVVAGLAAVAAVVLAGLILRGLNAGPSAPLPPALSEKLTLILSGDLAPLAVSEASDATRSLRALGVPEDAAATRDLSAAGLEFLRAYALPGPLPGAAVVYSDGTTEFIAQSGRSLSAPPNSRSHTVAGQVVTIGTIGTQRVAVWSEGSTTRVVSAPVSAERLLDVVSDLVDAPPAP